MSLVERYRKNPKVRFVEPDHNWSTNFGICSYDMLSESLGIPVDDDWIFDQYNQRRTFPFGKEIVLILNYDEDEQTVLLNRLHD